jgi:mannan endo-1,4-beta-mannosidase
VAGTSSGFPHLSAVSRIIFREAEHVRSRLVIPAAIVIAAAAAIFAITRITAAPRTQGPAFSLPARPASYLGVYEKGAPASYQQVATFSQTVSRQPNLVGYYSGWPEPFKTSFAAAVRAHGAATIVQMDPTLIPVKAIVAGHYDRYLRSFADSVRAFGSPVVIGFGHEMNADWYSWGYGNTPPSTFIAAWRHVVTLFRARGARNVTWLWTLQADEQGTGPIADWWPGAQYVTWVGIDGYYYHPDETFSGVFGKTIAQVRMLTNLPILLSEAAVGPQAGQTAKIPDLFAGMREYGMLGLVWFDIPQHQGIYHQDWHIEHNPAAATAFRRGASALTLTRV